MNSLTSIVATSGLALCLAMPLFSQISQNHPELCGDATKPVALPAGISVVRNPLNGQSTLNIITDASTHSLEFPNAPSDEIEEICPIGNSRLVVFGESGSTYRVHIVDRIRGTVEDSFWAGLAIMSPDQRWIAIRAFDTPHGQISISDEYLLYDLTASATANWHNAYPRLSGEVLAPRGWVMYPAFPGNAPIDLLDIPETETHLLRSLSFYWAPDSQAVVFADSVGTNLSIVVVLVKDSKSRAYTRAISPKEVCGEDDNPYVMLKDASISNTSGAAPVVVARFDAEASHCQPRQLTLNFDEFQPAKVKVYEHRKLKESTPRRAVR